MITHTIGAILFAIGIAMAFAAVHAFADAKRANEPINDGSDCFHGERFTIASERDHG